MISQRAFTLIELIIVVTVIAILLAIAYPSYTAYQIRTQRVNAQTEMLDIARNLSNYKLANYNYAGRTVSNIFGRSTIPLGKPLYDIVLTDVNGNPLTASNANVRTWLLVATPKSGTNQFGNGVICLNDQGQRFWAKGASACILSPTSNWDGR
ncbi:MULTISPECIES: type IV pilin protein [unclassified Acinetobacter]|jgi:type IV pilus assembly protein PilE|uniref:type IV pilin protein n=1 Tax=unclassified Acinetobacter TaxID=196816 RepID=UPI000B3C78B6|nr:MULTISPECIES: prepilin-type N-terminal cleavage/methylation domain-containing protein [unclassified Acinetobacter]AZM39485.1 prepilin-type N-terminal cleavage/methylation domain-containing protein [Acinetobacter baumannii]